MLADDARQVPANSYGAQKAAAELILADASRRGFLDAVSLRLPTVIVRPGRPNKAASSFFSAIVREPLLGLRTELPVADDFAAWVCQPAPRGRLAAARRRRCDTAPHGPRPQRQPAGHQRHDRASAAGAGAVRPGAAALVRRVEDPAIAAIVGTWPAGLRAAARATLGFARARAGGGLIRAFVEDDLAATRRRTRPVSVPIEGNNAHAALRRRNPPDHDFFTTTPWPIGH